MLSEAVISLFTLTVFVNTQSIQAYIFSYGHLRNTQNVYFHRKKTLKLLIYSAVYEVAN